MRTIAMTIVMGLGASLSAGEEGATSAPAALDFAHAGVSITLPEGFLRQQPTQPTELLRALNRDGEYGMKSITLSALPLPPGSKLTPSEAAEKIMDELRGNLAIRHLRKESPETPMPAGKLAGVARLISYTFRGEPTTAAMLFAVREGSDQTGGVCYQLTVESAEADKDTLLPLFGRLVSSLHFAAPRPTDQVDVGELHEPINDYRMGYSLRPPVNWSGGMTQAGVVCGQFDYTRGQVLPKLQVAVRGADMSATSATISEMWANDVSQMAAQAGVTAKLVSRGPAKMGGRDDAYQFVLLQVPPTATTQPNMPSQATVIAHRSLCAVGPDGRNRCYGLVLLFPGGDTAAAARTLDQLAEGFALITEYPANMKIAPPSTTTTPVPTAPAQPPDDFPPPPSLQDEN